MRDQQGFTDFASARASDLRRQAYLLTGSPERAARLADRALADTGRRWDKLGGSVAAEEHARRLVAAGAVRVRGAAPPVATTPLGTAAPTDDAGEAVRRALAGLPPRRRAVLVLRYDEGLDDAAVGARLGVPAATAAAEGEAGLATLRSLLRRRGRPEDLLPSALAEVGGPAGAGPAGTAAAGAEPTAGTSAEAPPRTGAGAVGGAGADAVAADAPGTVAGTDAGAAPDAAGPGAGAKAAGGAAAASDAAPAVGGAAAATEAAAGGAAPTGVGDATAAGGAAAGGGGAAAASGAGERRGGRRWGLVAAAVVVLAAAAAVLVPTLRDDSGDGAANPVPAASANGPGQLPWPARGPLAGDQDVLRSALRAWQAGVPERQRPERAAALWAGDLDGLRTVLLQGTDRTGQSWVAEVIGTGDTPTLRVTEPLGRTVPLLCLGTSAGAVHLLPPPDAESGSVLAAVGAQMRPLALAGDGLTQGVTAPPDGLRVALTQAGAVVGSATVLPDRISPTSGGVELTRSVLDLGPAQPPAPVWYEDGELVARRLGGPVGVVQVGPTRSTAIRVGGRRTRLEARGYEAVRAGTRHLATVIRVGGAPACTDTSTVGPADVTPDRPVLLVARCIPRGAVDGVLAAVGTGGVRSVRVTVAPATRAARGRPARAVRVVTIGGVSGTGLVGLSGVPGLHTSAAPAVGLGPGNRPVARFTLPPYRAPHP